MSGPFTLAHLSDPHVGPLPQARLGELMSKRLTGYWNWHRSRHRIHDMPTLKRLMADVAAHKPDHVALTGDIVNIGLPSEFPAAARVIAPLGGPRDVSIVPGNHDVYVRNSYAAMEHCFGAFMRGDDLLATEFPYMRVRGRIALIGLCSGIPTAPLLASGACGDRQLGRLGEMLRAAGAGGMARVVMIHHPPLSTGATFGRGLRDARQFEAVLRRAGAELVVHGHNHSQSVRWLERPGGPAVPVVGVASASAVPGTPRHRAAYHLFQIGPDDDGAWRIEMTTRVVDPEHGMATLGRRMLRHGRARETVTEAA